MSNKKVSYSYTKLMYSIIDYINATFSADIAISSYINTPFHRDLFVKSKIAHLIQRKRNFYPRTRFFLTFCLDDSSTSVSISELDVQIRNIVNDATIVTQLDFLAPNYTIDFFSKQASDHGFDFIAFSINISNDATIECIISLQSLTNKLTAKDSDGDIVEFH
ncbi:MAG: hypothetical protein LBM93_13445, partial [Oscillospiraceae bacterium]|nr:hypothetical protein [Oscillospiraceae bacterium]